MEYAVVDIETTGAGNKITEIAIYVYDDVRRELIDEFSSLVNPESPIPSFITGLTGITNEMVESAPRFFEIAKQVHEITENRIFVAHNVGFDYNVIRAEYRELGAEFKRQTVCTVRMSRSIFPGLRSYSLGKLCNSLGIGLENRHRAGGDAKATVELLALLLDNDSKQQIDAAIKGKSRQSTLPPNLDKEVYEQLPEHTGVYYFHDAEGKVIYVGKAKDIRSRVNSHFLDSTPAKLRLKQEIHDISYTLTGSELLALVLESAEIKQYFPKYNRAQKYTGNAYVLCKFEGQNGVVHLEVVKKRKYMHRPIASFSNVVKARNFLEQLVKEFRLCPKFCGLQTSSHACFDVQLGLCNGVCRGDEDPGAYNNRVEEALHSFVLETGSYAVLDKGRHREERCFLLIENGQYRGYGFFDESTQLESYSALREFLTPQQHNTDIQHILHGAIRAKRAQEIIYLE